MKVRITLADILDALCANKIHARRCPAGVNGPKFQSSGVFPEPQCNCWVEAEDVILDITAGPET